MFRPVVPVRERVMVSGEHDSSRLRAELGDQRLGVEACPDDAFQLSEQGEAGAGVIIGAGDAGEVEQADRVELTDPAVGHRGQCDRQLGGDRRRPGGVTGGGADPTLSAALNSRSANPLLQPAPSWARHCSASSAVAVIRAAASAHSARRNTRSRAAVSLASSTSRPTQPTASSSHCSSTFAAANSASDRPVAMSQTYDPPTTVSVQEIPYYTALSVDNRT